MKKQFALILSFVAIGFIACKPHQPQMFEQENGIYFSATTDSLMYTFAKYPTRTVDTIKIPVSVLGNPVAQDREISIESLTGSDMNGKPGLHYKLLPPYSMPADT